MKQKSFTSLTNKGMYALLCFSLSLPSIGYSDTADKSVLDTTPPTVPQSLSSSSTTTSQTTLNWSASDDDNGTLGYNIFRDDQLIGSTDIPTFVDTGLEEDREFIYQISAFDTQKNTSAKSQPLIVRTREANTTLDDEKPDAPDKLTATSVSSKEVILHWEHAADNRKTTAYQIYKDNEAIDLTSTPFYVDTNIQPNAAHSYHVTSLDEAGNESVNSNVVNLTTPEASNGPDTEAPSVPTELEVSELSQSHLIMRWSPSGDNTKTQHYNIYMDGTPTGEVETTFFMLVGANPNEQHSFAISAVDEAGNESEPSKEIDVTTLSGPDEDKPESPTITDVNTTARKVKLSWSAAVDNVAIDHYDVVRDDVRIARTSGLTFTDKDVAPGQTLTYFIVAEDTAGNLSSSQVRTVTTSENDSDDTEAPGQPEILAAVATENAVELRWSVPDDNVGVTSFKVIRDGEVIAEPEKNNHTDQNVVSGDQHTYTIVALDAAGNESEPSEGKTVLIPGDDDSDGSPNIGIENFDLSGECEGITQEIVDDGNSTSINLDAGETLNVSVDGTGRTDRKRCIATYTVNLAPGFRLQSIDSAIDFDYQLSERGSTRFTIANRVANNRSVRSNTVRAVQAGDDPTGSVSQVLEASAEDLGVDTSECGGSFRASTAFFSRVATPGADGNESTSIDITDLQFARINVVSCDGDDDNNNPPNAPINLEATEVGATQVTLNWENDPNNVDIVGFRVFRDKGQEAPVTVEQTTFTDTGLTPATEFTYQVSAIDARGVESEKTQLVVTTKAEEEPDDPEAPGEFSVKSLTLFGDCDNLDVDLEVVGRDINIEFATPHEVKLSDARPAKQSCVLEFAIDGNAAVDPVSFTFEGEARTANNVRGIVASSARALGNSVPADIVSIDPGSEIKLVGPSTGPGPKGNQVSNPTVILRIDIRLANQDSSPNEESFIRIDKATLSL